MGDLQKVRKTPNAGNPDFKRVKIIIPCTDKKLRKLRG
jgi:hypothetical protein